MRFCSEFSTLKLFPCLTPTPFQEARGAFCGVDGGLILHYNDSAKSYYRQALLLYNQGLSNVDKSHGYDSYEMSKKPLVLILLNRGQERRAIFKELSEAPSVDEYEKQEYHNYLVTPRDKFLKDLKP